MAVKLDMAKAFARVKWSFIVAILCKFEFPSRFTQLVSTCISTATFQFNVNEKVAGYANSIRVPRRAPAISHLLFADDSFLFCKASIQSYNIIKEVLAVYERATGQKVNFQKSSLYFSPNKNKVFSKGGKEILLKSVIQVIPTYTMACFRIPSATCHSLESIMANFWSKKDGGLGFRSLVHFNQALLAKQAWRILKQPNSIVSKILFARYYPNSSFLNSTLGHSPSFVWRSICWGKELLHKGLISKIGNGQNTFTTRDHWIPGFCQITPLSSVPDKAASFITPSMTWDISSLRRCYPSHVVDMILSIPLPLRPSSDELIWGHSNLEIYTVKTGYHLNYSSLTPPDIPTSSSPSPWWKNLWHLKIPPKVKHFTFRATNSTLPTLKNLASRKIIQSSVCDRCGNLEESVSHALFYCKSIRRVWKGTHFSPYIFSCSTEITFHDIAHMVYVSLSKEDVELFLCTGWLIWFNRNKALRGQAHDQAHAISNLARSFLDDYNLPTSAHSPLARSSRSSAPTSWSPPDPSRLKLNLDAAIPNDRSKAGFGETDCKAITDAVNFPKDDISIFGDLIRQIKEALSQLPAAQISHVNRSANTFADRLAQWASGLDEAAIWIGDDPCNLSDFLFL
ncbi:uncharacterized protein LOC115703967 [Cannabis sativa]|uniref:uncharacterized protein LOC115703967 n=1 Tax=Cannabis sativa TaxID=3483 RepID=UPI0029CA5513|nr:uncharacterized protein LOC115703967 [Cannabis sativa]